MRETEKLVKNIAERMNKSVKKMDQFLNQFEKHLIRQSPKEENIRNKEACKTDDKK